MVLAIFVQGQYETSEFAYVIADQKPIYHRVD